MTIKIKELVKNGVGTVFTQLSELVETTTLTKVVNTGYDAVQGTQTTTTTTNSVASIFLEDAQTEGRYVTKEQIKEGNVEIGLKKVIMKVEDVSIELDTSVKLLRADGSNWAIIKVAKDPTNTLYTVFVRGESK